MSSLAHYHFIPTVRDGVAAWIRTAATSSRVNIDARLTPSADNVAGTPISKIVGLYGPGDVVGFDPSVVVRTDPRPDVGNYESNFMPLIEFHEPDFPWRFTPDQADSANGKLMPWLTLIVLIRGKEFNALGESKPSSEQKGGLPVRWIEGVNLSALPDPKEAWMWAHVQLTAEEDLDNNEIKDRLAGNSSDPSENNAVSRLLCPRRLAPKTEYTAFVVPTFKIGQLAAQLLASLDTCENALTAGWSMGSGTVDLPYYYKWEFATGVRGDFEELVRQLEARALTDLGKRRIDCSSLQYNLPPVNRDDVPPGDKDKNVLEIEGALLSPDMQPTQWGNDRNPSEITTLQKDLANLVNMPTVQVAGSNTFLRSALRPPVVPPIYGRWHSGKESVDPSANTAWINHLNLDPRERIAAGLGALVVEKNQEALMASLWDQLGDIDSANNILKNAQLGMESSNSIYRRFDALGVADFLWMTAPVFKRTPWKSENSSERTVSGFLSKSRIPAAAFDPAFRRCIRPRGGLRNRQKTTGLRKQGEDILSRLNSGDFAPAGPHPKPKRMPSLCDITEAALESCGKGPKDHEKSKSQQQPKSKHSNDFCEEAITCDAVYEATSEKTGRLKLHHGAATAICLATQKWLSSMNGVTSGYEVVDLNALRDGLKTALDPKVTIPARISKRMRLSGNGIHQDGDLGKIESEVEFPQPMYEPLRDISQDWILPGIETVPQNTISIVKTNRKFMESYMVGLNHSFSGEALWRQAPVYLWTSFFRQFWDVRGVIDSGDDPEVFRDIQRLTTWKLDSSLGEHDPRHAEAGYEHSEQAVLLVRSDLLKRYPNTLVYAAESQQSGLPALQEYLDEGVQEPDRIWPIFSGSLPPDLTFLGFDKTPQELCSGGPHNNGYFIVLEERLGEPRFGFDLPDDETSLEGSQSLSCVRPNWWYDLTWANLQTSTPVSAGEPLFPENSYIDDRVLVGAIGQSPKWGASSASVANICLQRPVRIAIHASKMLSKSVCEAAAT